MDTTADAADAVAPTMALTILEVVTTILKKGVAYLDSSPKSLDTREQGEAISGVVASSRTCSRTSLNVTLKTSIGSVLG